MLLGNTDQHVPLKRVDYIQRKWRKKGWLVYANGNLQHTDKFRHFNHLAKNRDKIIAENDGRVVTVTFRKEKWCQTPTVGVLEDHGDNGWYFYTTRSCKHDCPFWIGDWKFDPIAYVEPHPAPAAIWKKINYLFWHFRGVPDRFHNKITQMCPETKCDYSRAAEGIFTYSNPFGKIGECQPTCQCKRLGNKVDIT